MRGGENIKTHKIEIYPNKTMLIEINRLFNYRRYIWNMSLEVWNKQYQKSLEKGDKKLTPNGRFVRNYLVDNKQDWQYNLSSRVLQQTVDDLDKGWKNFFNPNMPNHKRPKFKSKKNYKPTFRTDRARIKNGKLVLDKPRGIKTPWYGIRMAEQVRFDGNIKTVTINEEADGLYANIIIDSECKPLEPANKDICGIDVNVKRFTYNDGEVIIYSKSLDRHYSKITHYQKMLARKRLDNPHNFRTKRYEKVRTKLRLEYQKVSNIQNDIIQKFTTQLVKDYSEIHIEDLDIQHMKMNKHMNKNLHRSQFGIFGKILTYKCAWYGRKLVKVDRFYPSTQICSNCGFQKTKDGYGGKQTLGGDSIHHNHQKYYCYNCGVILDRDENAVKNIINYSI